MLSVVIQKFRVDDLSLGKGIFSFSPDGQFLLKHERMGQRMGVSRLAKDLDKENKFLTEIEAVDDATWLFSQFRDADGQLQTHVLLVALSREENALHVWAPSLTLTTAGDAPGGAFRFASHKEGETEPYDKVSTIELDGILAMDGKTSLKGHSLLSSGQNLAIFDSSGKYVTIAKFTAASEGSALVAIRGRNSAVYPQDIMAIVGFEEGKGRFIRWKDQFLFVLSNNKLSVSLVSVDGAAEIRLLYSVDVMEYISLPTNVDSRSGSGKDVETESDGSTNGVDIIEFDVSDSLSFATILYETGSGQRLAVVDLEKGIRTNPRPPVPGDTSNKKPTTQGKGTSDREKADATISDYIMRTSPFVRYTKYAEKEYTDAQKYVSATSKAPWRRSVSIPYESGRLRWWETLFVEQESSFTYSNPHLFNEIGISYRSLVSGARESRSTEPPPLVVDLEEEYNRCFCTHDFISLQQGGNSPVELNLLIERRINNGRASELFVSNREEWNGSDVKNHIVIPGSGTGILHKIQGEREDGSGNEGRSNFELCVFLPKHTKDNLLNNVLVFENMEAATTLCALNGWDVENLKMTALYLGLSSRQLNLLSYSLRRLTTSQQKAEAAEIVTRFCKANALLIEDDEFISPLLQLATNVFTGFLHELANKLLFNKMHGSFENPTSGNWGIEHRKAEEKDQEGNSEANSQIDPELKLLIEFSERLADLRDISEQYIRKRLSTSRSHGQSASTSSLGKISLESLVSLDRKRSLGGEGEEEEEITASRAYEICLAQETTDKEVVTGLYGRSEMQKAMERGYILESIFEGARDGDLVGVVGTLKGVAIQWEQRYGEAQKLRTHQLMDSELKRRIGKEVAEDVRAMNDPGGELDESINAFIRDMGIEETDIVNIMLLHMDEMNLSRRDSSSTDDSKDSQAINPAKYITALRPAVSTTVVKEVAWWLAYARLCLNNFWEPNKPAAGHPEHADKETWMQAIKDASAILRTIGKPGEDTVSTLKEILLYSSQLSLHRPLAEYLLALSAIPKEMVDTISFALQLEEEYSKMGLVKAPGDGSEAEKSSFCSHSRSTDCAWHGVEAPRGEADDGLKRPFLHIHTLWLLNLNEVEKRRCLWEVAFLRSQKVDIANLSPSTLHLTAFMESKAWEYLKMMISMNNVSETYRFFSEYVDKMEEERELSKKGVRFVRSGVDEDEREVEDLSHNVIVSAALSAEYGPSTPEDSPTLEFARYLLKRRGVLDVGYALEDIENFNSTMKIMQRNGWLFDPNTGMIGGDVSKLLPRGALTSFHERALTELGSISYHFYKHYVAFFHLHEPLLQRDMEGVTGSPVHIKIPDWAKVFSALAALQSEKEIDFNSEVGICGSGIQDLGGYVALLSSQMKHSLPGIPTINTLLTSGYIEEALIALAYFNAGKEVPAEAAHFFSHDTIRSVIGEKYPTLAYAYLLATGDSEFIEVPVSSSLAKMFSRTSEAGAEGYGTTRSHAYLDISTRNGDTSLFELLKLHTGVELGSLLSGLMSLSAEGALIFSKEMLRPTGWEGQGLSGVLSCKRNFVYYLLRNRPVDALIVLIEENSAVAVKKRTGGRLGALGLGLYVHLPERVMSTVFEICAQLAFLSVLINYETKAVLLDYIREELHAGRLHPSLVQFVPHITAEGRQPDLVSSISVLLILVGANLKSLLLHLEILHILLRASRIRAMQGIDVVKASFEVTAVETTSRVTSLVREGAASGFVEGIAALLDVAASWLIKGDEIESSELRDIDFVISSFFRLYRIERQSQFLKEACELSDWTQLLLAADERMTDPASLMDEVSAHFGDLNAKTYLLACLRAKVKIYNTSRYAKDVDERVVGEPLVLLSDILEKARASGGEVSDHYSSELKSEDLLVEAIRMKTMAASVRAKKEKRVDLLLKIEAAKFVVKTMLLRSPVHAVASGALKEFVPISRTHSLISYLYSVCTDCYNLKHVVKRGENILALEASEDPATAEGPAALALKDMEWDERDLLVVTTIACKAMKFHQVMRAYEVFDPKNILTTFVQFLQMFTQRRYDSATTALRWFKSLLDSGEAESFGLLAKHEVLLSLCLQLIYFFFGKARDKISLLRILAESKFRTEYVSLYKIFMEYLDGDIEYIKDVDLLIDSAELLNVLIRLGKQKAAIIFSRERGLDTDSLLEKLAMQKVKKCQASTVWKFEKNRIEMWESIHKKFTLERMSVDRAGRFFEVQLERNKDVVTPLEASRLLTLVHDWYAGIPRGLSPVRDEDELQVLENKALIASVEHVDVSSFVRTAFVGDSAESPTIVTSGSIGKRSIEYTEKDKESIRLIAIQLMSRGKFTQAIQTCERLGYYPMALRNVRVALKLANGEIEPDDILDFDPEVILFFEKNGSMRETVSGMSVHDLLIQLGRLEKDAHEIIDKIATEYEIAKFVSVKVSKLKERDPYSVLQIMLLSKSPDIVLMKRFLKHWNLDTKQTCLKIAETAFQLIKKGFNVSKSATSTSSSASTPYSTNWNPELFVGIVNLPGDELELGRAFMGLLGAAREISSSELSQAASVEILIRAHFCFSVANHRAGVNEVLETIQQLHQDIIASNNYALLVRILLGIDRPKELEYILIFLLNDGYFESMLGKIAKDKEVSLQRVLAKTIQDIYDGSKKKERSREWLQLLYLRFDMYRELAALHEEVALERLDEVKAVLKRGAKADITSATKLLTETMKLYLDAATLNEYKECYLQSRKNVDKARLIALQLQLIYTGSKEVVLFLEKGEVLQYLNRCQKFEEALVVATVYDVNTFDDWVHPIFSHVILKSDTDFFDGFARTFSYPEKFILDILNQYKTYSGDNRSVSHLPLRRFLKKLDNVHLSKSLLVATGLEALIPNVLKP